MTECEACGGTRFVLGGWMGPTPAAPYPHPCPACSLWLTGSELQKVWAAYLATQSPSFVRRWLKDSTPSCERERVLAMFDDRLVNPGAVRPHKFLESGYPAGEGPCMYCNRTYDEIRRNHAYR